MIVLKNYIRINQIDMYGLDIFIKNITVYSLLLFLFDSLFD